MEHESHISDEPEVGAGMKIIAIVAVLIVIGLVGAYVVYGSGMI